MPFKLSKYEDEFIDNCLEKSLMELEDLFQTKLKPGQKPSIITIDTRKEIDSLKGGVTPRWLVGWTSGGNVMVLNHKTFPLESDNKYSVDYYRTLIKHELIHIFTSKLSSTQKPVWLNEGVALCFSGQLKLREKVSKFQNFLKFYDNNQSKEETVYQESGFVVDILNTKFGFSKIIDLLKIRSICKSEKGFNNEFLKIYGFELNYDNINKL